MEQSIKRKINVFGKVGKIIVSVFIVLLLVAEGFMLVGGVIVAVLPKDSATVSASVNADVKLATQSFGINNSELSVKAGDANVKLAKFGDSKVQTTTDSEGLLHLTFSNMQMHFDLWDALKLIGIGMLKIAAIVVALHFLKALMKRFMVCDSPFCSEVVKAMRAFAIALIPTMAVSAAADGILNGLFAGAFSFGSIDLVTVGFVVVIFVLTMIFKYGAMLQKQYDETV